MQGPDPARYQMSSATQKDLSACGCIVNLAKKDLKEDNVSQQRAEKMSLAVHGITFMLATVSTGEKGRIWEEHSAARM